MGNPLKGEVILTAGEQRYTLLFSVDAICRLEAVTGKGFPVLAVEMANPATITISVLRELLFAGLAERHPDITVKDAGELIPAAGGMMEVMSKVSEALALAFPEASGTRNPPKPGGGRGTGRRST